MVLTAAQTTSFFEQGAQMGIPNATVVQLRAEGIESLDDLADFDKDSLQQLADNLRRPGGRVPDPNPVAAAAGATIPTPPFVFGAKSQKRLLVACDLVRYYQTVGRPLTAANMQWNTVIKNFEIQWKAIKDKKDEDEPELPKISRALPIVKWTEAFRDYLQRCIGVRMISLAYVIREEETPPAAAPALEPGQPHSQEHGSVESELVARASHTHALFRDDSATVYYKLEEATRSTQYAASIKPFQRNKDGRGAWNAIVSQFAGTDKWEAEIKRQEQLLHTRVWKGQSNFSLEAFISQHRNAFVSLQACAEHVQYQLPNEHSRVGFLLEGIQCSDAGLQAAMASVKTDNAPDGLRNNFEATAAHLLPYDPVAKKRQASGKRGAAQISGLDTDKDGTTGSATTHKAGIGKTGVHLRYHKTEEYHKLTKEQKDELRQWRKDNPNDAAPTKGKAAKKWKKQIAAIVASELESQVKKAQDTPDDDDVDAATLIASVVKDQLKKQETAAAAAVDAANSGTKKVTLKSILKMAKNGQP